MKNIKEILDETKAALKYLAARSNSYLRRETHELYQMQALIHIAEQLVGIQEQQRISNILKARELGLDIDDETVEETVEQLRTPQTKLR